MASNYSRNLTALASTLAVITFVIVSSVAVVWANGLRYNPTTGSFEQTVLIAVDSDNQNVNVNLNGQVVSDHIPYRVRNLLPDSYALTMDKEGFQSWHQTFRLSRGQVGLVSNPTFVATKPLVTVADSQLKLIIQPPLDFGLDLNSGELSDRGDFITRFSQSPIQVHRINSYYLYQVGNQLRLFVPAGSQDWLVYTASTDSLLPLILYPSTWQVAVTDGDSTKLVNLTIPGSTER